MRIERRFLNIDDASENIPRKNSKIAAILRLRIFFHVEVGLEVGAEDVFKEDDADDALVLLGTFCGEVKIILLCCCII